MLCTGFQSPLADPLWPRPRSLWPEARPLFYAVERDILRHLQEMRHNMEHMEKLHQRIFEQMDQAPPTASFRPVAVETVGGEGAFALSLDTSDFSPEELTVKQLGRQLRVSGKTERKQDDGQGSYAYRCQEFRQEFHLPEGVDPETVSCSLVGGRLQITAPQSRAPEAGRERLVPITVAPKPGEAQDKEAEPAEKRDEEADPGEARDESEKRK